MQSQICNAAGSQFAKVYPWGNLQIAIEGRAIFADPFDGTALDTTYRWNTPVVAGAGAIAIASGGATFTVGTGASSAIAISTMENFLNLGISFLQYATIGQFEAGAAGLLPIGVNQFFGKGTPNASFTAATPLTDAIGFERTIDGNFSAVVYNNGTKVFAVALTSKVIDGAPHVWGVASRGDTKYFFIDNLEVPVATSQLVTPAISNIPIRAHSINHTTPPTVAPTFKLSGVQVLDSGGNYNTVFNGTYTTRARSPVVFKNINNVVVTTETTIWTPAAGRKFRLMGFVLTGGVAAGNILLKDNTGGATILVVPIGTIGATIPSVPMGNGILSAAVNNVLTATGASTQTLSGYVFGTEE